MMCLINGTIVAISAENQSLKADDVLYNYHRDCEEKLGKLPIIVEDLGFLTPSVIQLLKDSGFPGMKVIQLDIRLHLKC